MNHTEDRRHVDALLRSAVQHVVLNINQSISLRSHLINQTLLTVLEYLLRQLLGALHNLNHRRHRLLRCVQRRPQLQRLVNDHLRDEVHLLVRHQLRLIRRRLTSASSELTHVLRWTLRTTRRRRRPRALSKLTTHLTLHIRRLPTRWLDDLAVRTLLELPCRRVALRHVRSVNHTEDRRHVDALLRSAVQHVVLNINQSISLRSHLINQTLLTVLEYLLRQLLGRLDDLNHRSNRLIRRVQRRPQLQRLVDDHLRDEVHLLVRHQHRCVGRPASHNKTGVSVSWCRSRRRWGASSGRTMASVRGLATYG